MKSIVIGFLVVSALFFGFQTWVAGQAQNPLVGAWTISQTTGSITYRYRFDGESLLLTLTGGWAPRAGEITYRLDRLE